MTCRGRFVARRQRFELIATYDVLNLNQLDDLPAVRAILAHAEATRRIVRENYQHLTDEDERLTLTVEENVLVQLENLRTHPSVAAAISRGGLNLHAWVYQFESGQVFSYDPGCGQFVEIRDVTSQGAVTDQSFPVI